jgi:carboxylesterase type B
VWQVAGQSAGAIAVCALLGCPKAKGLFQRAIVQSGGVSIWPSELYQTAVLDDYKAAARPHLAANGRANDDWTVEAWRSLTSEQLHMISQKLETAKPMMKKHGCLLSPPVFNAVVDDDLFEGKDPVAHVLNGCSKEVDLLLGDMYCEAAMLTTMIPTAPVVNQVVSGLFGYFGAGVVLPLAIRGFAKITKDADSTLPPRALKLAAEELVAGFATIALERFDEMACWSAASDGASPVPPDRVGAVATVPANQGEGFATVLADHTGADATAPADHKMQAKASFHKELHRNWSNTGDGDGP